MTGIYKARPSIPTISNAMDIGDPPTLLGFSNFMVEIGKKKENMVGYGFSDEETKTGMKDVIDRTGYLMEPHGVIGYMAVKEYQKEYDVQGIVLETAHPAKFGDVVEPVIGQKIDIPQRLQDYMDREKVATLIKPDFDELKQFLLARA